VAAITRGLVWLVQGITPFPARAWDSRTLSPVVWPDVGVVHEPVDGGGGQGLGHELVEPGRVKMLDTATLRRS